MTFKKYVYFYLTILLFSLFVLFQPNSLSAIEPVLLKQAHNRIPIGTNIEYFKENKRRISIQDIIKESSGWFPSKSEHVNLDFSMSGYWFRFSIENKSTIEKNFYLEIGNPLLDNIELYIPTEREGFRIIKTGNTLPFNTRDVKNKAFVFDINIKPGTSTYYFHISNYYMTYSFFISILSKQAYIDINATEMLIFGMFVGLMIIMMLYNLFVYISTRDQAHIDLVLLILSGLLLYISLYGFAPMFLWPDLPWWSSRGFFILTPLVFYTAGRYFRSYLDAKENFPVMDKWIFYIVQVPAAILIGTIFLEKVDLPRITVPIYEAELLFWKLGLPILFLAFLLFSVWIFFYYNDKYYERYAPYIKLSLILSLILFFSTIIITSSLKTSNGAFGSTLTLFPQLLFWPASSAVMVFYAYFKGYRPARYLLAASLIVGLTIIILQMTLVGVIPLTRITFYVSPAGVSLGVAIISIGLADKLTVLRKEVEQAEIKYRNLVENSNDIIFSLDQNLSIQTINSSVRQVLGFSESEIVQYNFLDLIQDSRIDRKNREKEIVKEYISKLRTGKKSVSFRAGFKTNYSHEPIELAVKLEDIESEDKAGTILGKASQLSDDIMLGFLDSENHTYTVSNYFSNAELLSQRLTMNLGKYLGPSDLTSLRIALREILLNAIEHGNLSISFEEKSNAIQNGKYMDFIQKRQHNPLYNQRKITVEYTLDRNKVTYQINDEGEGFDHKSMIKDGIEKANEEMLYHGRGLYLAHAIFDIMQFNEVGNQVYLLKHFKK